jgi:hypothetical protein
MIALKLLLLCYVCSGVLKHATEWIYMDFTKPLTGKIHLGVRHPVHCVFRFYGNFLSVNSYVCEIVTWWVVSPLNMRPSCV